VTLAELSNSDWVAIVLVVLVVVLLLRAWLR